MQTLLISDVHGNLPALEKVLRKESNADLVISLGDVVNYGPWGNECVDLLTDVGAVNIMGNHEEYFIQGHYAGASALVRQFFDMCYMDFDRMDAIQKYKTEHTIGKFICRHTVDDLYVFSDTPVSLTNNMFIGHSHAQFIRQVNDFLLVNTGSVGQNRREINVINYALYDTGTNDVTLNELVYDHKLVIQKMREKNYPQECLNYYLGKNTRPINQ
jgi:putative phosphoesterase